MRAHWILIIALAACGAEAEDEDEEAEGGIAPVSTEVCGSGLRWAGGDEEDPRMHPGRDCIDCHTREDEGPRFAIAGTVYGENGERDDCFGLSGVTVEITDADGAVHSALSNQAGNFFLEESVPLPYTARLIFEGRERPMGAEQSVGACNSCHTETGTNAAPGRIIAP